jgi:hypothetical protein
VVDGRAMPTDPIDHDAARVPKLGCTALRCTLCGEKVRSIANKRVASGIATPRELFEATDVEAAVKLVDSKMRIYYCRCAMHTESGQHPLDDLDGGVQVATQWGCSGHPIATLPHAFDGVIVAETNLTALVAQALAGDIPPGAHAMDRKGAFWIARLCARLEGTPHAHAVAIAVAKHLVDPDVMTRTRAVHFFTTLARHLDVMRADKLLGDHAALFAGVRDALADSSDEPTLEHTIWRLVGDEVSRNTALRDIARVTAKDPARGSFAVFNALVEGDLAWFSDHAEELARLHPTRTQDLLTAARNQVAIHRRIQAAAKT